MTLLLLDNVMGGYMTGQEYFVECVPLTVHLIGSTLILLLL